MPTAEPWSAAWTEAFVTALATHHGPQGWWPGTSDDARIIGMHLVQRATWATVEGVLASLESASLLDLARLAEAPREQWMAFLAPLGMVPSRASRLQRFARAWTDLGGTERIRQRVAQECAEAVMSDHPRPHVFSEGWLLELPGVGRETAACLLTYILGQPAMVVDATAWRIIRRVDPRIAERLQTLHPLPLRASAGDEDERLQRWMELHLPAEPELLGEVHAWLIQTRKTVCTPRRPDCDACAVQALCVTGRRMAPVS